MSTQTLPLPPQHFDNNAGSSAAEIAAQPQSFWQKAFAAWIRPYENAGIFFTNM